MDTFLSPKVKQLVCEVGAVKIKPVEEDELIEHCLHKDGLLQWDYLENVVFEGINIADDVSDFEDLVGRLAPVCQAVDKHVSSLSVEEFTCRYHDRLTWTGAQKLFLRSLEIQREDHHVGNTVCLLLVTAALERALGDVFLLKNSPCPSMLKDLLGTEELGNILGNVVVTCLRILIGPPTSLNLRNIVWHGFAGPFDIPVRYNSFLLVLIASMGAMLDENIPGANIPHRLPLKLPQIDQLQHVTQDFELPELSAINNLFSQSKFIAKFMLPYWRAALKYYKQESYGICVVLLLTQLEQSLRQVFATVNNCPDRVLTAESTVLFTTFDEMLCPTLPDGSENALLQAVGVPFMEILLDLLEHQEGPRLRDHISHGELDIMMVSKEEADYVLLVSGLFCVCTHKLENRDSEDNFIMPEKLQAISESYTSVFHPISKLKSELIDCINSMTLWNSLNHPSHDALQHDPLCNLSEEAFHSSNMYLAAKIVFQGHAEEKDPEYLLRCLNSFSDIQSLHEFCKILDLHTLFRPRSEFELVVLLRRIVQETRVVITNVAKTTTERYQQWVEKKLRSRQRNNYVRLLNSEPQLSSGVRLTLLIIALEMKMVNNVSTYPANKFQMLVKFFKSVLQYTENMAILTGPDRNKWDECCKLTTAMVDKVAQFFTKWHHM